MCQYLRSTWDSGITFERADPCPMLAKRKFCEGWALRGLVIFTQKTGSESIG
jgi:hypothetical protein